MQNMKVEFNKEVEVLKKTQTEMKLVMKTLIIVIKSSLASLANRMGHSEYRIAVLENKVEELDYSIKESIKKLKAC